MTDLECETMENPVMKEQKEREASYVKQIWI